jgi:hypothetical protein
MGEAIGGMTAESKAILLGRTTFEMFAPAWSTRTADDDPGAPFFNDTRKYLAVVLRRRRQDHAVTGRLGDLRERCRTPRLFACVTDVTLYLSDFGQY